MLLVCIQDKRESEELPSCCHGFELLEQPKKIHLFSGQTFVDLPWELPSEEPARRIASYHNFSETPEDLEGILSQMQTQPAYAYKIATKACSTLDALRMLAFVKRKRKEGHRLIGLCLGEEGSLTRILSPIVGNLWNYTYIKTPAAPGQIPLETLLNTYQYPKLNASTKLYGLIGNPVAQSISLQRHNAFFQKNQLNAIYVHMRLETHELDQALQLMRAIGFKGVSVTIPHKERLFPFLTYIDPLAQEIGAVNTLRFTSEGLEGYNTDARAGIDAIGEPVKGKRIICLGAGGAAKALAYEARRRGAEIELFNRARLKSEEIPHPYHILINATPDPHPMDLDRIYPGSTVMEINPTFTDTPFLRAAHSKGCRIVLGMEMFLRQAEGQFKIWDLIKDPTS